MKDIEEKLEKYSAPYVHGEKRTSRYEKNIREKQTLKRRKQLLRNLKCEAKYLNITQDNLMQTEYLIRIFNDKFKQLHKRASEETIILAFLFYTLRLDDSRIQVTNYRISKKYDLTEPVFSLIVSRMLHQILSSQPIPPTDTIEYDHDLLLRNGGRA